MKCRKCGAIIKMRDMKCPYCGQVNAIGHLWSVEKNEAKKAYDNEAQQVRRTISPYVLSKMLKKILIVEILLILLYFLGTILYFFGTYLHHSFDLKWNRKTYESEMEQFYNSGKYGELYHLLSDKELFGEEYPVYSQISLIYNDYTRFIRSRIELAKMIEDGVPDEEKLDNFLRNISYFTGDYFSKKEQVYPENEETYQKIRKEIQAFCFGTLKMTVQEYEMICDDFYVNRKDVENAIQKRMGWQ